MDSNQGRWGRCYGGGQIVKRETIKTDATGKATLTFDTPAAMRTGFRVSHRSARDGFHRAARSPATATCA